MQSDLFRFNDLKVPRRLAASVLATAAACAGSACRVTPSPAVETPIAILHINLRGVADVPNGDRAGYWETRFQRIGTELKAIGATPDVIALQEVAARLWCPDNWNFILDYEPLYVLLRSLQTGIGVQYRVAFMQVFSNDRRVGEGPTAMGGTIRECRGTSGLAMLYNPNRLQNLSTGVPVTVAQGPNVLAFNQSSTTHQLRRSMPCCAGRVRPGTVAVCGLIDGPAQTDVCGETPAGLAMQVTADVAVGSFELAVRKNTQFHVYNVHLPWSGSSEFAGAMSAVRGLLSAMEIDVTRWIPPVMVGDFNDGPEKIRETLSDFESLGGAELDMLIHTMIGNAAAYAATAVVGRFETVQLPSGSTEEKCQNTDRLWTDHCAVLTTLWIRER